MSEANWGVVRAIQAAGLGTALLLSVAGCHKTPATTSDAANPSQSGADPANGNMAPLPAGQPANAQPPARVLGQSAQGQYQQQGEDYSQQQQQAPAPIVRSDGSYSTDQSAAYPPDGGGELTDQQAAALYEADLTDAQANNPPPPLPDYSQPQAPDPDYLWTPGYWAWGPGGYYWVPGAWVSAPYTGALWTPGYWGFYNGFYRFHHGYWGLHIGYYGGINYGFGYVGHGYYGGYWRDNHFFYNGAVNRVNVNVVHNVYVRNVTVAANSRVSYDGGRGGIVAHPLAAEAVVLNERRIPPVAAQVQAEHEAAGNRQQFFSENHGRPAVTVAAHPIVAEHALPAELPHVNVPIPARPSVVGHGQQPMTEPQRPQGNVAPGIQQQEHSGAQPPRSVEGPRPVPQGQPQTQPEYRPVPQPQNRPGTQPIPATPSHPQPEFRPVTPQPAQPQPQPKPEYRPVTPPAAQPQPPHPQPEFRPVTPQPQGHPAPQPQPPARPEVKPAPAPPHPAPPPPKPPPPHHEEEKKPGR
jgi:WXXGXW repeat (2 copies)